jgi:putative acetyltransferase
MGVALNAIYGSGECAQFPPSSPFFQYRTTLVVRAHSDPPSDAAATFTIREDDLSGEETRSLLAFHLQQMHANSPVGSVFALDLSGLKTPDVTVWTAWLGAQIVSVGALREFADSTGELKSMRTHPDHIRRGGAAAILEHIIGVARERGLKQLSLETGSGAAFEPALALYRKRGFEDGEAFSDYVRSPFNQFLHLKL